MLFFTKICMAVQLMERARSIDVCRPPLIDMWAPRRILECGMRIAECARCSRRGWFIPHSAIANPQLLKSLRMPVRFFQTSFTGILEKLVDRREQDARTLHVEPQIEGSGRLAHAGLQAFRIYR